VARLPSDEFLGASRIGNYGDCVMELDHNVGQIMHAVSAAGIDRDPLWSGAVRSVGEKAVRRRREVRAIKPQSSWLIQLQ